MERVGGKGTLRHEVSFTASIQQPYTALDPLVHNSPRSSDPKRFDHHLSRLLTNEKEKEMCQDFYGECFDCGRKTMMP